MASNFQQNSINSFISLKTLSTFISCSKNQELPGKKTKSTSNVGGTKSLFCLSIPLPTTSSFTFLLTFLLAQHCRPAFIQVLKAMRNMFDNQHSWQNANRTSYHHISWMMLIIIQSTDGTKESVQNRQILQCQFERLKSLALYLRLQVCNDVDNCICRNCRMSTRKSSVNPLRIICIRACVVGDKASMIFGIIARATVRHYRSTQVKEMWAQTGTAVKELRQPHNWDGHQVANGEIDCVRVHLRDDTFVSCVRTMNEIFHAEECDDGHANCVG